jgi:cytochrome b pre-mRNA-processing protein 3
LPLNERKLPPVSFFSRLLGMAREDETDVSALWHRVVAVAREREWYADCGIADSVPGRFDAITTVLALALLRMEGSRDLAAASVRLTELFVEDMDGQLREAGIGDMVVGKHIGKLMSAMGGRLGAYREALAQADNAALEAALARNVTMVEGADATALASRVRALTERFAAVDDAALLRGEVA